MTNRYRLRHPSLAEEIGPYTLETLREAVATGTFPRDSEVRAADDEAGAWRQITELLGLPRIERPQATAPPARHTLPQPASDVRTAIRDATAYGGIRLLANWLVGVGIVIAVVMAVVALRVQQVPGTAVELTVLGTTLFYVLSLLVLRGALFALLDIADCALRREGRGPDRP